jgi:hypothetical protein
MLHGGILEAYAKRELGEPLHDVSIKKDGVILLAGHGRLLTSENGGVAIDLYSKGKLPDRWHNFQPGEPYSLDDLPVLEAVTDYGHQVAMRGAQPSSPSRSTDAGFSRVRFHPFEVEIRFDEKFEFSPSVKGIVTPFAIDVSNSCSSIEDDNPMFGTATSGRDWLNVEIDGARAGFRKDRDDLHWFAFATKKEEPSDVVKYAEAFLTALSFVVGESVSWLACRTYSGTSEIVRLRQPGRKRKGILNPPLPFRPFQEAETELLANATSFFHDEANSRVAHLLELCWDVLGGYCHSEYAVVCIAVEALADFTIKKFADGKTPQGIALKAEMEQLDRFKLVAAAALKASCQIDQVKDSRSVARVTKWIEELSILQAPKGETIITAAELINASSQTKVNISPDEIDAWKKLRNSVSHGGFRTGATAIADFQKEGHQFDCCVNIINKLVLGLMGFKGEIVDYSASGYPTVTI